MSGRNQRGRTPKVSAEQWVETARRVLIEEGVAGVKVDRLAQRLGVTRGGFYHNFTDRQDLLGRLLAHWEATCLFLPAERPGSTPAEAAGWMERVVAGFIDEERYDRQFDMAVREWGRADPRAGWAMERADRERIATLGAFFDALGYSQEEAQLRARVFYFHQIGYYAIGVRQPAAERRRNAALYLDILCGAERLAAARTAAAEAAASEARGAEPPGPPPHQMRRRASGAR